MSTVDKEVEELFKDDTDETADQLIMSGQCIPPIESPEELKFSKDSIESPDELKKKNIWQRDKMEKVDHFHAKIMLNYQIARQGAGINVLSSQDPNKKMEDLFSEALVKVLDEELD